jgi:protein-S-isoprenylcysteine O-methyltransferase Ste14
VIGLGVLTSIFVFVPLGFASLLDVPLLPIQAVLWLAWLAWLGYVFPRRSARDKRDPGPLPYRRAFGREIALGIALAFSQFLRPVALASAHADTSEMTPLGAGIGLPLALAGVALIGLGVTTLGIARTLFVHEYIPGRRPLQLSGIYLVVRHPMFVGGALSSLGLTVALGGTELIVAGLLNLSVLPFYVMLEDRRCCAIFGRSYTAYRQKVGGALPRRHSSAGRPRPQWRRPRQGPSAASLEEVTREARQ